MSDPADQGPEGPVRGAARGRTDGGAVRWSGGQAGTRVDGGSARGSAGTDAGRADGATPVDARPAGSEGTGADGRGRCPECGGSVVSEAGTETVCTDCGLVVGTDRVDHGPEWRSFDDDRRPNRRVGAPATELRHDRGLSATVGWDDRDGYGQRLSSAQRRRMNRLRKLDSRYQVRDARDRNLRHALGEIDRMGCALGLPDGVREAAAVTYRRALAEDVVLGRSIEAVASACLYAAARQAGTPRSTDEVATVSRVEKLPFVRAYREVARELGLEVDLADPAAYLRRYASELSAWSETEREARRLLRAGQGAGAHVGKSPTALAAAALYAAGLRSGQAMTQAEVCDVADVCEVTIRNRYQDLLAAADDA